MAASKCFMFMYFLLPHWVPATWRGCALFTLGVNNCRGMRTKSQGYVPKRHIPLHEYDFLKNKLDCGDSNRYMDHLCGSNGLAVYQYLPGR